MISDWQEVELGEMVAIKHGWPFKSRECSEELLGGPIVVNVGNFNYSGGFRFGSTRVREYRGEYPRDYELEPGDTLLVMTCQTSGGEILGIPARVPDDRRTYLHNQRLGKVEVLAPHRVSSDFLYYLFLSPAFNRHLFATASGTKILHTAPSRIESFRFKLPPLDVQKRIGHILSTLDDKIELNRKMNRTLEEIAQTLFRAWFVDFEGETDLVESEVGLIPRGWEVQPIGDLVKTVGGGTPTTKVPEFWDGGTIHWTTPKDLSGLDVPILMTTARKITKAGLAKVSSGLLPKGTVLLSSRAPVGYTAISTIPTAVNQGYIAIPPGGGLSNFYVLFWLRENMERIKNRAGGTTFREISKRNFRPILALKPPKNRQDDFDKVAGPLFDRIALNARQSRTLAEIRDTLLPKLISGEIRVPAAEEVVEQAV